MFRNFVVYRDPIGRLTFDRTADPAYLISSPPGSSIHTVNLVDGPTSLLFVPTADPLVSVACSALWLLRAIGDGDERFAIVSESATVFGPELDPLRN